jgi:hypothetical protein
VPGLPIHAFDKIDVIHDMAEEITKPMQEMKARLVKSLLPLDAPSPASASVVADDGSGLSLRTAYADGGALEVDCSGATYTPVVREATRTVNGCGYDYASLLRFPCTDVSGNGTSGGDVSKGGGGGPGACTLAYDVWSALPYGGCAATGMDDVSLSAELNLGLSKVPAKDTLSVVRFVGGGCCVDEWRWDIDSFI